MKRFILIVVCAIAQFYFAQQAGAFPGERMPYRIGHFAHKVAYKIDQHVVHPVTHGIARRVR